MNKVYHIPTNPKEQYIELCKDEIFIPIMMQSWWLDAVCPDEWDVCLVSQNDEIIGAYVYQQKQKLLLKYVTQPPLTQYSGVWIRRCTYKSDFERLSEEKKIMINLIQQLEKKHFNFIFQNFHYNITNWLPFHWHGFTCSTRYTYIIPSIFNNEKVFANFSPAKQRQIHKAEKNLHLDMDLTPDVFYVNHKQALNDQGKKIDYSYPMLQRLWQAANEHNQGQILTLRDDKGEIHSSLFLVWDISSGYNLLYFTSPRYAASGASSLIVWEAIKFLKNKTKRFDFEGSMIESIAKFNKQFSTIQMPYFYLEKNKFQASILSKYLKRWLLGK